MTVEANQGAFTALDVAQCLINDFFLHALSTDTTINQARSGRRLITYDGGVLAITLGAPASGTDDGRVIAVVSATAHAHTVTCTGHLLDGAGHSNTATFAAQPAAGFEVVAWQGNWLVVSSVGVTFS